MRKRVSHLPAYIAVGLAALAAILSAPTMARDVEAKLLWMLQTQALGTEAATGNIAELQKLGLP